MKLYGYKVNGETVFGDPHRAMENGLEVVEVELTMEQAEEILDGLNNNGAIE